MFIENSSIDEKSIIKFEKKIGFKLPDDYRIFLKNHNGGICKDEIIKLNRPGDFLIDCFFGLGLKDALNLQFWHEELSGELPEKSIVIGCDPGGGYILLCVASDISGVYYYDHTYSFPSSSDDENTYFIAPDFTEFFGKIIK